jgi:hypothetical protein
MSIYDYPDYAPYEPVSPFEHDNPLVFLDPMLSDKDIKKYIDKLYDVLHGPSGKIYPHIEIPDMAKRIVGMIQPVVDLMNKKSKLCKFKAVTHPYIRKGARKITDGFFKNSDGVPRCEYVIQICTEFDRRIIVGHVTFFSAGTFEDPWKNFDFTCNWTPVEDDDEIII